MSQPVIRFENVGKLYRLGTVGTGTLAHDLRRWWITSVMRKEDPYLQIGETNDRSTKGNSDYVYALKDINLEVHEGDVLGIIGKNGAGKSTLLKLLSRVTAPTTGKIYTKGRIASLLEVGTGFHPELTGRENIYMNGSILGMKKLEIDHKLDEIIDFSGCERYIDTPVKRYSSGMMVRLGFAVAAHLDPEILVVDEVLAVGDAEFQKKAIGKMQDVSKSQGRTVLFVSHNMDAVLNLCKTGILLENGKVKLISTAKEAIDQYTALSEMGDSYTNNILNKSITITDIHYTDSDNNKTNHYITSDNVSIKATLHRNAQYQMLPHTMFSINVYRHTKIICVLESPLDELINGTTCTIEFILPKQFFTSGPIHLDAAVHIPNIELIDTALCVCNCDIWDAGTNTLKYNGVDCGVVQAHPSIKIQIYTESHQS